MQNNGNKITLTYLRKDLILTPIIEAEEEDDKLIEEIVAVEVDFPLEEAPVAVDEEAPVVVEEPVVEVIDELHVVEEPVVEEPVIEEPVVEEPVKKKRTYNKKKKA
jgi:hypothetical protein